MNSTIMQAPPTNHLNTFDLDRLVFGQLPNPDRERAQAHLAACLVCRKERDARVEDGAHFDGEVFRRTLPAVLGRAATAPVPMRRRWTSASFTTGMMLAAAAVLALWVRGNRATNDRADPAADVQTKGSFELLVYARHRGAIKTLDRYDQTVHPGSELRFVLAGTPADMRFAVIASVDAKGVVSVYFPYQGTTSAEVPRAGRWEAPGSIVLDGTLGPERVFAILSPQPLATAAVRSALDALVQGGPDAVRDNATLDLPGTKQQSFLLLKEAGPEAAMPRTDR
jgi:hypothetical protein